jgi:dTDP-glucose pyrophosphorylase
VILNESTFLLEWVKLSPRVWSFIPTNETYHITQVIEVVIKQGKHVGVYPIDDDAWINVGQWVEYQKEIEKW